MRLTRDRKSTTIFKHFRIARRRPVPHRRQRQNRPILQFPPRQATEAKGFGSLFLRREVVTAVPRRSVNCTLMPTLFLALKNDLRKPSGVHGLPSELTRMTGLFLGVLSSNV